MNHESLDDQNPDSYQSAETPERDTMKKSPSTKPLPLLVLAAQTAADLMTPSPVSINANATATELVAFLVNRGFSAAPVIDEAGRPVGVVSQSDLLAQDRRRSEYVFPGGSPLLNVERARVRDIMTPLVVSIPGEAPAHKVIEEMLTRKIHQLFVVNGNGVLVGIVTALDVLRHLRSE